MQATDNLSVAGSNMLFARNLIDLDIIPKPRYIFASKNRYDTTVVALCFILFSTTLLTLMLPFDYSIWCSVAGIAVCATIAIANKVIFELHKSKLITYLKGAGVDTDSIKERLNVFLQTHSWGQ